MAETADTQRLIALVEANTKSFERAMNRLEGVTRQSMGRVAKEVSKVDAALNKAGIAVGNFVKGFALGAIGGGIAGLASLASNAVKAAAALQDVSDNTGISAENLQKLAFAAEQSGGSADALLAGFRKFNQEIGEAATKGNELKKILDANGVSLTDANGNMRDNLAIWNDVVGLISNAKDETQAAYIAQVAMGRSAAENLNFFRQGTTEIERLSQVAADAGLVISNEMVAKADDFVDRWSQGVRTWEALFAKATINILGGLEQIYNFMHRNDPAFQAAERAGMLPKGVGASAAHILGARPTAPPPPKKTTTDPVFGDYDKVVAKLEKVKTVSQQLTETITEGFSNMGSTLLGVARGAESLDKALQRTLDNILNKLTDQAFQQLIAAIVGGLGPKVALPGVGPGGMGFTTFGGPRQSGGAVARGKSYLVGERGPELFSPNMSGYVMPRGRGGGGNTQVHIHTPPGMVAETKKDQTANGTRVDVLIREAVRKELPGVMKPMLRDQYGVTPVARKRF